jgi:hypothetical protein
VVRALTVLNVYGLDGLAKRMSGYLYRRTVRRILPTIAEVKYSGVPISRERKFGDAKLPNFLIPYPLEDIDNYEQTLILALQSEILPGDKVTIVGGGEGVTAVIAAKAVGETGSVVCFEGSNWGVRKIKATASRNNVSKRLSVEHAVVGKAINVYGGADSRSVRTVRPEDLPECDILELDCEGAEITILRNMIIRPRIIAVETHGVYGAPTQMVKELLEGLDYEVRDCGVAEPRIVADCEANDIRVLLGRRN